MDSLLSLSLFIYLWLSSVVFNLSGNAGNISCYIETTIADCLRFCGCGGGDECAVQTCRNIQINIQSYNQT